MELHSLPVDCYISRVVLPLKRVQKDRSPPYAFDGLIHHLAGCIDGLGWVLPRLGWPISSRVNNLQPASSR